MSLLDTASLIVTPNGYKEGKLYSVIPSDGSGDMSVVRATTATRVNSAGLVELVPYNLLEQSNSFNGSPWTAVATITPNATTAPDGTMTATRVQLASGGISYLYQGVSFSSGAKTISCYIKGATAQTIGFNDGNANPNSINITTEWQRYTFTFNSSGGGMGIQFDNYYGVSPSQEAKDFYIWGAQFVEGSTAKDYQKTETRLNIPRLDYSNGTCPSLLVEPQRTNLLTWSSSFDNGAWSKENATSIGNISTSPSGIFDADTITDNSTLSRHIIYQSFSGDLSISRTFSTYAKQNTLRYLALGVTNGGDLDAYTAIFDLQTGTATDTNTTGSATISASIEDAGNGWYRCSVTGTMTSGTANYFPIIGTSDRPDFTGVLINNNFPSYSGTGKDLLIWGAQLEVGSYPTSYIPTQGASVTRNADVISKTGISSLIGQTEGTLFVDFYRPNQSSDFFCMIANSVGSGAYTNSIYFYQVANNVIVCESFIGGALQFGFSTSALSNGRHKLAIAYKQNDFAFYIDGQLIGVDTSGNIPTLSTFTINGADIGNLSNGGVNASALWKTRLTNTQLAQLTSI